MKRSIANEMAAQTGFHSVSQLCVCLMLPDIVMTLDVDFVKDPFWGLQEILFHLHSYVSGQQAH